MLFTRIYVLIGPMKQGGTIEIFLPHSRRILIYVMYDAEPCYRFVEQKARCRLDFCVGGGEILLCLRFHVRDEKPC